MNLSKGARACVYIIERNTEYRFSFAICDSRATVAVILFEFERILFLGRVRFRRFVQRDWRSRRNSISLLTPLPFLHSGRGDGSAGIRIIEGVLLDLS